jgi:hypothetical protein
MISFVTINTIVSDLLLQIRGSQLTQSETISKRQVENWVHQYRALLLKQEWDKKKYISPDWTQTIQALELEEVTEAEGSILDTDYKTFRTKIQVPNTISHNWGSGFLSITTINGQEIQFSPESRSRWQKHKKYTSNDPIAYLKNGYLYVENDKELRYISTKGLHEVPPEVSHLNNPNETIEDVNENSPYPIPIAILPTLKQMILKQELGIISQAWSDVQNDSASDTEPNVNVEMSHTSRTSR